MRVSLETEDLTEAIEAGVTFHNLRRTLASLHVSGGTPIRHVAKWLSG